MELRELIGLGGVPLIIALVELVKRTIPELPVRFHPALAVFWGIVLNVALAYLLAMNYGPAVLIGVVAGLAAAKLYEYGAARGKEATFVEYDPDEDVTRARRNLGA